MKEKYELIPMGEASHLIRKFKKHWWNKWQIEMDGNTPRIYLVDQDKCAHRLRYIRMVNALPNYVSLPLFRCEKCGYEQIGNEHLKGHNYE